MTNHRILSNNQENLTTMKKLLFIILSVFIITACDIVEGMDEELVYVRLENISDEKMESFTLNNADFGTIKSDRKSKYVGLEGFTIQGDYPMAFYECEINGEIFSNKGHIGWCATGAKFLEPGRYTVKVDIREFSDDVFALTFELEE